jgi:HSP20 family molecular chaperone IbpA
MANLIPRTTLLPDLFRYLEQGWPFAAFGDHHPVRIEEYLEDGTYVLRAELPGFDPDKDVKIAVEGDQLSITAERTVDKHDKAHSEFFYGSFARTVRLPAGADADAVEARYDAGILEITVPVKQVADTRQIPVAVKKK